MEYNTTIDPQGQTTIGTIEVFNYTMTATFRFTIKEQVSYYSHQTQTYYDRIVEAQKRLEYWEMGEKEFTSSPPDYQAMIDKEVDKLKKLNDNTPRYEFTRIFNNGEIYMDRVEVFLQILEPYPEQQQTATIALEKIRWLAERMKSTNEERIAPPSTPEDEDTIMLRQQIEALDLPNVGTEYYPLLYTLRDAWHAHNKPWAADNAKFAVKIAHILLKKASTITQGLNRACKLLRKKEKSLECYPLATLESKQINISGEKNKKEELERWNERRKKIQQVMSMDIAKTSICKSESIKK